MKKIGSLLFFAIFLCHFPLHAQQALLDVTPLLLDFGNVEAGSTKALGVTLTNLTAAPLPITGFAASGDGSFSIDVNGGTDPCGSENPTLEANGSCTMAVSFAPMSAEDATGSVTFTPNSQADSSISVRFLGQSPEVNTGGCSLGAASGGSAKGVALLFPLLFWAGFWRRRASV